MPCPGPPPLRGGRQTLQNDGSSVSSTTRGGANTSHLRYAKFTIGGIPGEKHAVFIPDVYQPTASVLANVCRALGREAPSLLLCGVGPPCHPARLSTPELRRCPGFGCLMAEAQSSLGLEKVAELAIGSNGTPACSSRPGHSQPGAREGRRDGDEGIEGMLADVVDRVLERKLASAVSSVANTACRANAWTLTGPRVTSFELLLQQGINSGEAEVFRLVVGHLQDRAYMDSELSRQLLQRLFLLSRVMSAETVDQFTPIPLQGDLWSPAKNHSHPEFSKHGFEYWSFDSWGHAMLQGHPITQWPWPHGDLFLLFYREDTAAGATAPEVDWAYRTKERLDRDAIPFAPESLAPLGRVFIGGKDPPMKRILLQGMRLSRPMILLDNTPDAPKQVSLLVGALARAWEQPRGAGLGPLLAEGAGPRAAAMSQELLREMVPSRVLQHVEEGFDSSGMDAGERLSVADVEYVLEVAQERPQALKRSICVLDPLNDAEGRMVSKLVSVLASDHGCTREQLLTASSHQAIVLRGWTLQVRLAEKARWFRWLAGLLTLATALVVFLNSLLAVLMVYLHLHGKSAAAPEESSFEAAFPPFASARFTRDVLPLMPVFAGALLVLQRHLKPCQKWALIHMTASQVVAELYMFLGGVGPYNTAEPLTNQRRLADRFEALVRHLSRSGFSEGNLLASALTQAEAPEFDPWDLQQRTHHFLYGAGPLGWGRCWPCGRAAGARTSAAGGGWTSLLVEDPEWKGLTAPLTAEAYVEVRLAPLRRHYRRWLRVQSWLRTVLNAAFALSLGTASVLGASGFSLWILAALSLAAFEATLAHWLVPAEICLAVNKALSALNDLDLRWQGSDIQEHRSEATKRRLIMVTESQSLAVAMTLSRAAPLLGGDDSCFWRGGPRPRTKSGGGWPLNSA